MITLCNFILKETNTVRDQLLLNCNVCMKYESRGYYFDGTSSISFAFGSSISAGVS